MIEQSLPAIAVLAAAAAVFGWQLPSLARIWIARTERGWWASLAEALTESESYQRCTTREPPPSFAASRRAIEADLASAAACQSERRAPAAAGKRAFLAGLCAVVAAFFCTTLSSIVPALLWTTWGLCLIAAAAIDHECGLLPDELTIPSVWIGLIAAAAGSLGEHDIAHALAGATAGYIGPFLLAGAFQLATGRQGMGNGDFKLLAAIGAWIGPLALVPVLLVAMGAMLTIAVARRIQQPVAAKPDQRIPFGPYLVAATLLITIIGPREVLALIGWGALVS